LPDTCKPIGHAYVKLKEVLDFPSNKLHGSVVLYSSSTQKNQPAKTNVLGTLEYWFKLHVAGIKGLCKKMVLKEYIYI